MAIDTTEGTLTVHIEPMRRKHLRAVLAIEEAVYPKPWTMPLFVGELAQKGSRTYYVAKVNNKLVGYGGLLMQAEDGHITNLAVDPQWHRHHIGSRLMIALARDARFRRANAMTLEVRMTNKAAQNLYRRFGFRPAGVRKNYYAETHEDALVMWAHDVMTPEYDELLKGLERQIPGATTLQEPKRWWQK